VQLKLDETAFPVNTGDVMPPGTDAVVMIEHVEHPTPDTLLIRASVAPRQHVRLMGEDMVTTELVLPVHHRIRPVDVGAIAGSGHSTVAVYQKPHVVIIPTGSELIGAGQTPAPGQIIEYNSLVLQAQIEEFGGQVTVLPAVADDLEQLKLALEHASAQADLILVLSGSSAGSRDFTALVLKQQGRCLVHGVAVRPGHPVILGTLVDVPVIGVPGYPVSAALTGELFILPLLAHWLGIPAPFDLYSRIEAQLTRKLTSPVGDDDFVRVMVAQVGQKLLATPLSRGAGVISSLVRADGLAHIPRFSEGANSGQMIPIILLKNPDLIQQTILALGSHDPMLDALGQVIGQNFPGRRFISVNIGSLGGLIALKRGEAHLAGIHLLDTETGIYNRAYVEKYLAGMSGQVIHFARREQGFIVAKNNPLAIQGIADLPRVRFVNRQRGSGTRLLLDYELQKHQISPEAISGYENEEYTHLAVAVAVASGIADCGLGVRQAAVVLDLEFVSLGWEEYDLVIPSDRLQQAEPVLTTLQTAEFQNLLATQPGYDTSQTGQIRWHFGDN
jgi:putative molybdopterin biosynthesis protein